MELRLAGSAGEWVFMGVAPDVKGAPLLRLIVNIANCFDYNVGLFELNECARIGKCSFGIGRQVEQIPLEDSAFLIEPDALCRRPR